MCLAERITEFCILYKYKIYFFVFWDTLQAPSSWGICVTIEGLHIGDFY